MQSRRNTAGLQKPLSEYSRARAHQQAEARYSAEFKSLRTALLKSSIIIKMCPSPHVYDAESKSFIVPLLFSYTRDTGQGYIWFGAEERDCAVKSILSPKFTLVGNPAIRVRRDSLEPKISGMLQLPKDRASMDRFDALSGGSSCLRISGHIVGSKPIREFVDETTYTRSTCVMFQPIRVEVVEGRE